MSQRSVEIRGATELGFEPVREAFAANFERYGDVGAAWSRSSSQPSRAKPAERRPRVH
ncbi:MAG: hypothetical protein VX681_09055 [Myxococcota bacterium]|nr:hypothetical protein [Myxococcota bacterium]